MTGSERTNQNFDVIFDDPPYKFSEEQFQQIIDAVFKNELLNTDGMLIIEHSKKTDLSQNSTYTKAKKYGGNMFSFF